MNKPLWTNCATTLSALRLVLGVQYGFDMAGIEMEHLRDLGTTDLVSKDGTRTAQIVCGRNAWGLTLAATVHAA